jgi:hypothetical protein
MSREQRKSDVISSHLKMQWVEKHYVHIASNTIWNVLFSYPSPRLGSKRRNWLVSIILDKGRLELMRKEQSAQAQAQAQVPVISSESSRGIPKSPRTDVVSRPRDIPTRLEGESLLFDLRQCGF